MPRTDAGHAAGENLAALLHELGKNVGAFVIDQVHFLDAKLADFLLAEKLPLAATRPTWTAAGTARAATFTASTTATGTTLTAPTTTAMSTVTTMPAAWSSATWSAGTRGRSRSRLRSRRCLILFVCHNVYPFSFNSFVAVWRRS
jgi:hypothetical protein